ncbi:MAG: hypothetical protein KKH61_20145, partial [Gammaproteobacteria bacterium]|nr:hypothetical protein [Gammaproteobacteria bacterium]
APSTEKARTVFLDYLERQGTILRGQRNLLRDNMVASRLDSPESVLSDVELHYELVHREVPYQDIGRVQLPEPEREELPLSSTGEVGEVPISREVAEQPVERKLSPIARISLGVR